MNRRFRPGIRSVACVLCLAGTLAVQAQPRNSSAKPGVAALDYGFRFASAIRTADKNKAMAQQLVALEYARIGELDLAVERAEQVIGWRRGVVYAELASEMVKAGRSEDARALIAKAEAVRASADSWYPLRIAAHVAHALALLGDVEEVKRISARLTEADSRQYSGRSIASVALGLAVRGEYQRAMDLMGSLDEAEDFDLTLWRTEGYVEIGGLSGLSTDRRRRALEDARTSAAGVQSWNQMELLGRVAEGLHEIDRTQAAVETLEQAEAMVRAVPDDIPSKAAIVSMVAGSWAATGRSDRALKLLEAGVPAIESAMRIEQPGIHARVAVVYARAGDAAAAERHFDRALSIGETLVNARPRALAVVAICRELGKTGIALDAGIRSRLDRLYEGLGDPW